MQTPYLEPLLDRTASYLVLGVAAVCAVATWAYL